MFDAVNNSNGKKQRGRPFKPGASGNPRGRPRGALNKRTRVDLDAAKANGELPLDYMLRIMRDPKVSNTRRDEMARTAAPYCHAKVATTAFPPLQEERGDATFVIEFVTPPKPPEPENGGHARLSRAPNWESGTSVEPANFVNGERRRQIG